MPARRELTMRQLRQMLRLRHDGGSAREIGRTLGVARSTIQDNLERARVAGIGWPLPSEWTDEVLEQRLLPTGLPSCRAILYIRVKKSPGNHAAFAQV